VTALLLVDIQVGLDELAYYGGERNNPQAENNCKKLLEFFRSGQLPVFHVQHCSINQNSPLYPGKAGHAIKPEVQPLPGEPLFQKSVNSAFIGTGLKEQLEKAGIKNLIIVGLTTEHCISTTVRMAANLGFNTTLVSDATAAFNKQLGDKEFDAELIHQTTLATLKDEFANITNTTSLLEILAHEPSS